TFDVRNTDSGADDRDSKRKTHGRGNSIGVHIMSKELAERADRSGLKNVLQRTKARLPVNIARTGCHCWSNPWRAPVPRRRGKGSRLRNTRLRGTAALQMPANETN